MSSTKTAIGSFYENRGVFVTGFTGFLGKVLVEKLLRSSPGVRIYALIRPQGVKDARQRMETVLRDPLFDTIRAKEPDFEQNVVAMSGDVTEPMLGLSDDDVRIIAEHVSIVFHVAATVRFDEALKVSLALNVVGVQQTIAVAKRLPKLVSFVHVSTAYSNCDRKRIEEIIYPPSIPPQKLIGSLEWMDSDMIDSLTPKLLGAHPNTYTFSKNLAEYVLVEEGGQLPFAIFRPSIVGASWKEPSPGWIDNMNGPSGLFIAAGKGLLRVMKMSPDAIADIVPVDISINMMLCIAWYTATAKPQPGLVYHCNTGTQNPCKWTKLHPIVVRTYSKYPFDNIIRRPNFSDSGNNLAYLYWRFVGHVVPAYFMDIFARMFGKKPRMVAALGKLEKAVKTLDFFTQRSWHWTQCNGDRLLAKLSPEDKKEFDFDVRSIDWTKYYEAFAVGTKKFVLREDLSNLSSARRQIIRHRSIRLLFNVSLFLCVSSYLIKYSKWARAMVFSLVHFCLYFLSKVGLLSSSGGVPTA